jgi:hypothetical protein
MSRKTVSGKPNPGAVEPPRVYRGLFSVSLAQLELLPDDHLGQFLSWRPGRLTGSARGASVSAEEPRLSSRPLLLISFLARSSRPKPPSTAVAWLRRGLGRPILQ